MIKLLHWINGMKILKKLMLVYIVGGLIPLLTVSFIISINMREALREQALLVANNNNERIGQELADVVETVKEVSDAMYLDRELRRLIATRYGSTMAAINAMNNYSRIDDALQIYDEISAVRIYVTNTTLLDNSQIIRITEGISNQEWYKQTLDADGKTIMVYWYDEILRQYHLSMTRLMKDDDDRILGVSVVNLEPSYMTNLIHSQENDMLVLFDNKHVLGSSEGLSKEMLDLLMKDSKVTSFRDDTGNFLLIHDALELKEGYKSIQLKTMVSLSSLYKRANTTLFYMMIGVLISAILSILMVYFFSRVFSIRVRDFRDDIHNVALGNFEIHNELIEEDEIGDLYRDLRMMVESIQRLIHENYIVELQRQELSGRQKDVQFKMLSSQINPHFLYNALETIRMKAMLGSDREIATIVKKLAVIMRRNLSASNEVVTLSEEMELIRHYLDIQKFRFGDRVTYDIQMDDSLEHVMVLPLLMQPLVENAFVHGLENKVGEGRICLRIWRDKDYLYVKVMDDGIGIEEDKLGMLNQKLRIGLDNIDGSIGLANVYQRIKIYYGNTSDMVIESNQEKGTTVTLKLCMMEGHKPCIR